MMNLESGIDVNVHHKYQIHQGESNKASSPEQTQPASWRTFSLLFSFHFWNCSYFFLLLSDTLWKLLFLCFLWLFLPSVFSLLPAPLHLKMWWTTFSFLCGSVSHSDLSNTLERHRTSPFVRTLEQVISFSLSFLSPSLLTCVYKAWLFWRINGDIRAHKTTSSSSLDITSSNTCHNGNWEEPQRNRMKNLKKKLLCITQYNKSMRAVDQVDMQNGFSECLEKTIKWYRKLFFHLFDITVQNSSAMFKMKNGKNLELSEFRLQLARELIEEYGSKRPQMRERPSTDSSLRLTTRRFIAYIPGDNVKKRCFVCSHTVKRETKRSGTRFNCPDCDVPLCNPTCFKEYHTLKAFWSQFLINLQK